MEVEGENAIKSPLSTFSLDNWACCAVLHGTGNFRKSNKRSMVVIVVRTRNVF